LIGPVAGPIGEPVIATFDELGKLDGKIVRVIEQGFEVRLVLGNSQRTTLIGKIGWLDRNKHHNCRMTGCTSARYRKIRIYRVAPRRQRDRLLRVRYVSVRCRGVYRTQSAARRRARGRQNRWSRGAGIPRRLCDQAYQIAGSRRSGAPPHPGVRAVPNTSTVQKSARGVSRSESGCSVRKRLEVVIMAAAPR